VGAGAGLSIAPVEGTPDRRVGVVIEHQVGVSPGTVEPALNAVLILRDGSADGVLGGSAVGVGGRAGDITLALQPLAKFVIGPADMLAEDVSTGRFVLGEVARRTLDRVSFNPYLPLARRRGRTWVGMGLARGQEAEYQD